MNENKIVAVVPDRFADYLERQKQVFRDLANNNYIFRACLNICEREGVPEEYAWLEAALALEQLSRRYKEELTTQLGANAVIPILLKTPRTS